MILSRLRTPLGMVLVACDEIGRVCALEFSERRARLHRSLREQQGAYSLIDGTAPPPAVAAALGRYFAGELQAIEEVEIRTHGTEFQERVWAELRRIPSGRTATYGKIGKAAGVADWRAAVEAGTAIGANPVAIVVPCHRVVASDGGLKGYAWGLHRKRWLLVHEGALEAEPSSPTTASLL
jgi:methylated-DNA-[protein]-cysteine S-methyltransferase